MELEGCSKAMLATPGSPQYCKNIMHSRYTISFRYTKPGEKKPGPIQRYVIYAVGLEEATAEAERYANYPNIQVLGVRKT